MGRVTRKRLIEEYNTPTLINWNWEYKKRKYPGYDKSWYEGQVYYWLGWLVYEYFLPHGSPYSFILKWDDSGVWLIYDKYGMRFLIARFEFICEGYYAKQNFKPLMCILSKLENYHETYRIIHKKMRGNDTFYHIVKMCSPRLDKKDEE